MHLFLLATILLPLAVLLSYSRTLGGYSLGSMKSNFINTFDFTAVVMWFWWLELVKSQLLHFKRLSYQICQTSSYSSDTCKCQQHISDATF